MRGLGILLVILGIIWALVAFDMEVTVTTALGRVNNLGLMETRRNNLMFAGLTILVGVVLVGFGSINRSAKSNHDLKSCPFCAEKIQSKAIKCRYCSADLTESYSAEPQAIDTSANQRPVISPNASEEELMAYYGISTERGEFVFRGYQFVSLDAALKYAGHQEDVGSNV